jgi:glycyl-tRNA synthetase beta chain
MAASTADFLVELGTEELPPKALRELELAFANGVRGGLEAAALPFTALQSFATPRRLAVLVSGLATHQPDQKIEKRGPPVAVAFDAAGQPTRAALAFAEGCGVTMDAVEKLETGKGAWLVFRGTAAGKPAAELLPGIVEAALAALPIPRRMRWGSGDAEFVRPVHWLVLLLGDQVIPASLLGQTSGRVSRGHRFHSSGAVQVAAPSSYAATLEQQRVLVDFSQRRERVRQLVDAAAKAAGGTAVMEDALLDEVTSLVEWPVPVTGRFEERFLKLPASVLQATLQGHQRYFPVRNASGGLLPCFITISNVESKQPTVVQEGNERVVRPRLTDAAFFYEQDTRVALHSRVDQLAKVVFQQGLGSLKDKSERVAALATSLAGATGANPAQVSRAAHLAKADLLSTLVGEFPELQGQMGSDYARHDGEDPAVCQAIAEQYLPRHAGDELPASPAGRALALADRLDTLAGIFALGKRPSGNKDPYGLRRAAIGLLRTLIEGQVELDLPTVLRQAVAAQPVKPKDGADLVEPLQDFLLDRLRSWYLDGLAPGLPAGVVTAEAFEAVRARRPASPLDFHARLLGVQAFAGLAEAPALAAANKRIGNLLRTASIAEGGTVNAALFEQAEEGALATAVGGIAARHQQLLQSRDYTGVLRQLAGLRTPVDAYFTAVMVMADDPAKRGNRLAQLQQLRAMFLDVLDRDGVINVESVAFIKSVAECQPIPGSLDAIARLHQAGFTVVVATNQSGVARGLFSAATLDEIHRHLQGAVLAAGGELHGFFVCPHGPGDGCTCRKPLPGLFHQIERRFRVSLAGRPAIGDSARDILVARAVGARPILVRTGNGRKALGEVQPPPEVFDDLAAAATALIREAHAG